MLCVHVLRRLRPPVSQTSVSIRVEVLRCAARALLPACSLRGASGTQLPPRAVRRSTPSALSQVQSHLLPARCLSSAAPSEDGVLIYKGSLATSVRGVKLFSYTSSGASLVIMPQILLNTGIGVQSLALQVAFCGVIGIFTFLTPILLHVLTKGYVVRLYHHPESDTYTAITYSVFLTEKKTVFHQNQVRIPAVSKMFTTFYGNNKGLLVNPDLFPIPHDYNHLMGYDKPFSFNPDDLDQPDRS